MMATQEAIKLPAISSGPIAEAGARAFDDQLAQLANQAGVQATANKGCPPFRASSLGAGQFEEVRLWRSGEENESPLEGWVRD